MPDYPIDLARDMGGTECAKIDKEEKFYPSIHLDWEREYSFPAEGTMTVKFKRTHESRSTDRDGKTRYSVGLDITSIEDVSDSKEEEREKSTGEVLDDYVVKEQVNTQDTLSMSPKERAEQNGAFL